MNTSICTAIAKRQVLEFDYQGYHRVVEPHAHGTSKTAKEMVRAYQTAGGTASGELGWKPFLVESNPPPAAGRCSELLTGVGERRRMVRGEA